MAITDTIRKILNGNEVYMDGRVRGLWISALQGSGYEQTFGILREEKTAGQHINRYRHCALGVLCNLYCLEKEVHWLTIIPDGGKSVPKEVTEWSGIAQTGIIGEITYMNDCQCSSFKVIAKYIERAVSRK